MLARLSLTHRLTVFFTLVAASVVLALGWFFMSEVERHFAKLDSAALMDKKHLIEEVMANANSAEDMRWRLDEALGHHQGLFAAVSDRLGATVFKTQGFEVPQLANLQAADPETPVQQVFQPDGQALRVLRFEITPRYQRAKELQVTLAMDTAQHAHFLADLGRSLAVYALMATLFSGLLGWLAAHQGLAPLRAMKARAAQVSAQHLDGRMPVEAVPVEMAELAAELNRMLSRLQSEFARLQDFASDLAHELRTPISNLLTQTQVTLSTPRDDATYRDILASNAEEMQRLARMVSDMLLLAKTERGVDLPHKERFSATQEVQALLEFYEAVAEEKRIALDAIGQGEIVGDRLMFRRAVSNLLSNALRHAPEGGQVRVLMTQNPDTTEVTVRNTGKDINAEALPRLFDRFFRADPARAHPTSDGAGLGLAITKAIAEAHGGSVRVSSARGTTDFTLVFPQVHIAQNGLARA